MKEANRKRTNAPRFHLHKESKIVKLMGTERRLAGATGWGRGDGQLLLNVNKAFVMLDE